MTDIETVFRARVMFEGDWGTVRAIEDKAFASRSSLEVESFTGCPACSPYVTAEGADRAAVADWVHAVKNYISSLEGAKLL